MCTSRRAQFATHTRSLLLFDLIAGEPPCRAQRGLLVLVLVERTRARSDCAESGAHWCLFTFPNFYSCVLVRSSHVAFEGNLRSAYTSCNYYNYSVNGFLYRGPHLFLTAAFWLVICVLILIPVPRTMNVINRILRPGMLRLVD